MKPYLILVVLLLVPVCVLGQYYLRGEVKSEKGEGLQNVRITVFSKGTFPYYSGASGAFGIPSNLKVDTITFYAEGYDTLKTAVVTSQFQSIILKLNHQQTQANSLHLSSFTKNLRFEIKEQDDDNGETYSSTIENQFVNTQKFPETGFALHVDRASYSNIRRFLTTKEKPPADAVRIEEMLNYFNFKTKSFDNAQKTFLFNTNLTSCPWNTGNQLLFINLQAKKINLDKTPPANLVFLIDVSGSMDMANRLSLLKSAFKLLVENLRSIDLVSIVTYGDKVTELLSATSGDRKQEIIETLEGLTPSGFTPGASAIRTAYNAARNNFIPNGNNRVILATDGDFNVGQTSDKELENIIIQESKTGIYLTCLGVGMGNYKDSKLETLAKSGNGNFFYLDNEKEAEKVLVEEFAQTLYNVANNVYLNVKFNPQKVKEYRLIGFDNKKSAVADANVKIEGGEIGSGHSILAAFELIPEDTSVTPAFANDQTVATLQVSYSLPADNQNMLKDQYNAPSNFVPIDKSDSSLRFAASVIMFGSLLKQSQYANNFTWEDLYNLASSSANPQNLLQIEFLELVNRAKKIYPGKKRKSG